MVHTKHDQLGSLKGELLEQLRPHGQEGVLRFWDELSQLQRMTLATQLAQFDLALVERLFHERHQADNWREVIQASAPPDAIRLGQPSRHSADQAHSAGQNALRSGKIAAVLVAGGQGTRLGFDHPKGMFPIGPVSGSSLFQILCEKVVATGRRYDARIPLFVMTSDATHDETVEFFAEHRNFGITSDDLFIYRQGLMPAIDAASGQLLLADKSNLCLSPDGHGGVLAAMASTGVLDRLRDRGIEHLFYFQIDNPLAPVGDPEIIGHHLLAGSEVTTLAVTKVQPRDPVGNIVSYAGRQRIVEYSEFNHLDNDLIAQRDAEGRLRFWAGNTAIHVFELAFFERMAADGGQLPFHVAHKRVPYVDETGLPVEPDQPNALKFERFIFDLLPAAERALVVEVEERSAFAPLKNAPGAAKDSPESVRAQMIALHQAWLRQAGVDIDPALPIEISPAFALDPRQLAERIDPRSPIVEPRYFSPNASRP